MPLREGGLGTVLLLSGGADSATLLALVLEEPPALNWLPVHPVTFAYGSLHQDAECESALRVGRHHCEAYPGRIQGEHTMITLPPTLFAGSALTDQPELLPRDRTLQQIEDGGTAASYIPARNTILLAVAAGRAEALGCGHLAYAAHWDDCPGYPDCTPEYVEAMGRALALGTERGVQLYAPFIRRSKVDILTLGRRLGVPYELTHSCYRGSKPACGVCDTCVLRIESFRRAGLQDPIPYAIEIDWAGLG